ncbi:hypothetical protein JWJ90_09590 [Desulfobulbus rhabdoformis]|uniref:hypothetical protein n=1 Tax=Desulfobulbus rhabdoformis TaxID=34032 RepID=UPI001963DD9B|nr:hypothetical protein [Desulfobulbus rhabdoformis]MBM9614542.1 hypothetical protein [Desulfobulbus rhabdoformis]
MESTWSLTGKSGSAYTFTVFTKSAPLSRTGGVLLPAYAHPRGHRAGFQVNPLKVQATDNMEDTRLSLSEQTELAEQCWNYTLVLDEPDPVKQSQIAQDLCNHV